MIDPPFARIAALPLPISHSLDRAAQLLRHYGVGLQLVLGDGQTVPLRTGHPAAPGDVSAGLTAGEHRIAMLVATGATNREVARRLFVSPKTVETHLTHIYQKTGVRSRTELAYLVATNSEHSDASIKGKPEAARHLWS